MDWCCLSVINILFEGQSRSELALKFLVLANFFPLIYILHVIFYKLSLGHSERKLLS